MTTASSDLHPPDPGPESKTSGLAIAGLIAGALGLCTFGLGGIVGLVLSILALRKIGRSAGGVGGRGLAVAGLIVSISTLLIGLVLAAAIGGSVFYAMERAHTAVSLNNARILSQCACLYTSVNDEKYPPADTWPQDLKDCGGMTDDDAFVDPDDPSAGRMFAMNRWLAGQSMFAVRDAGRTVLFFECDPGAPLAGDRGIMPDQPRHGRGFIVAFCAGHVEMVSPERVDDLIWNPNER